MPLVRFCLLAALFLARLAHAAPLEVYGRLPGLEDIAISPDGKHAAFVTVVDETRAVVIYDLDARKPIGGLRASKFKLRGLVWADGQHVLLTVSRTTDIPFMSGPRQEYATTLSYDIVTHRGRNVMDGVEKVINLTVGPPQPRIVNGHTVVFVESEYFPQRKGRWALFAADLTTNRTTLVDGSVEDALGWIVDEQGTPIARASYDQNRMHWSLSLFKGGRWKEVLGRDTAIDFPTIYGRAADGRSLVIREGDAEPKALSIDDGALAALPAGQYGGSNAIIDPKTHRIIGARRDTMRTHYVFFDPEDEKRWENIALALDGEDVQIKSWSEDRKRVALLTSGPRTGAAYVILDLGANQIIPIGLEYDGITAAEFAPRQAMVYAAADGLKIPAYLTLPKGRAPKNLPLVVLPHGGPAARDAPGFDWWSQALAARGYAVLQPQFRGSAGFTEKFMEAGYGEWGRKMQSDVSDGVRALAKQGVIDPARVCIVGASYGGYAALAGVTLENGVYRCAVAVAGVGDPRGMLDWIQGRSGQSDNIAIRYWDRFYGASDPRDRHLPEISPLAHAAQASAPILLIHGRDDTVVPISQSRDMAKALERAGKPVTFVTLDGEDHWLSRSETRLRMLQETVRFLEAQNPPG